MQPPTPSGRKAGTYALIAFICQAIGGFLFAVLVLLLVNPIVALYVLLLAIFLAFAGYGYVYRPIRAGRYELAKAPAEILGVLSFFLGGIFPIVFYSLTSGKIREAMNQPAAAPGGAYAVPSGVVPGPSGTPWAPTPPPAVATPPPPAAMTAPSLPAPVPPVPSGPLCPQCGRPATWIPQYQRYYCFPDNRYL
jgi:hypothetical protein